MDLYDHGKTTPHPPASAPEPSECTHTHTRTHTHTLPLCVALVQAMAAAVHGSAPPPASSSSSSSSSAVPATALDALAARVAGAVALTLADRLVWSLTPRQGERGQGEGQGERGQGEGQRQGPGVGDVLPVWRGGQAGEGGGMWLTATILAVTPHTAPDTAPHTAPDGTPGAGESRYTVRYLCDHAIDASVPPSRLDTPPTPNTTTHTTTFAVMPRAADAAALIGSFHAAIDSLRPLLPGPRGREIVAALAQVPIALSIPLTHAFRPYPSRIPLTHNSHPCLLSP